MKTLQLNHEKEVIVHNAVVDRANLLMEEIQEYEEWLKDKCEKEERSKFQNEQARLNELRRQYEVHLEICAELNKEQ